MCKDFHNALSIILVTKRVCQERYRMHHEWCCECKMEVLVVDDSAMDVIRSRCVGFELYDDAFVKGSAL